MSSRFSAPRLILLSFAGFILLGTILLKLPVSNNGISWLDAFFEAASAVTVTGLQTVDPAEAFTPFGQGVLVVLMQIGGVGIMTAATTGALLVGGGLGFRALLVVREELESPGSPRNVLGLLGQVALVTFTLELVGAVILATRFLVEGSDLGTSIGYGVFHAVSAFCNAGFDLFGPPIPSLYDGDLVVNLVFVVLIVLGGLGFPVLVNLRKYASIRRLTLHSKIVMIATIILLALGFLAFALLEWTNPQTLGGEPLGTKLLESLFQSATPRTAGFSTVEYPELRDSTLLIQIILMFIGAAPASTGGGVKVTTVALVFLVFLAQARGEQGISVFERRVPASLLAKTLSVLALAAVLVAFATVALIASDGLPLLPALFHVTSAFGTVGLNVVSSSTLTAFGKLLIVALMFAGRLGPLTLILALYQRERPRKHDYPEEEIAIG